MTETATAELSSADGDREIAEALIRRARVEGVSLVGPGGLLTGLTTRVLETALEAELTDHLGYELHERAGTGNTRNGTRTKTVLTEVGPVVLEVPLDRDATNDGEDHTEAAAPPRRGRGPRGVAGREGPHDRGGAGAPG